MCAPHWDIMCSLYGNMWVVLLSPRKVRNISPLNSGFRPFVCLHSYVHIWDSRLFDFRISFIPVFVVESCP